MIQFKEVAHLYVGCKIHTKDGVSTFHAYNNHALTNHITSYDSDGLDYPVDEVKPILRPLSDMTKEERQCHLNKPNETESPLAAVHDAYMTAYLLSCRFDLFGLIESRQAIYATTSDKDEESIDSDNNDYRERNYDHED